MSLEIKCPYCRSTYFKFREAESKREGRQLNYICLSCKKWYHILEERKQPKGKKIATFYATKNTGLGAEYVELYKDDEGNCSTLSYKKNIYETMFYAPKFSVSTIGTVGAGNHYYLDISTCRPFNNGGVMMSIKKIVLDSECRGEALKNDAMRAVYIDVGGYFDTSDIGNQAMLTDMANWLNSMAQTSANKKSFSKIGALFNGFGKK